MDMKWADDSQTSLSMALQDYNAMLRLDSMEADRDHYTAVMNSGSVGNQMWMPVCDLGDSSLLPSEHVRQDYSDGQERGDLFYGPLMYRYLNAGDPFMLEAAMRKIRERSEHLSTHPEDLITMLKETQTKWARYYLMCSRENTALRESVKSSVGLTNTISDVESGAVAVYGSTDKIYSMITDTDKSGAGMAALRAIYDDMVPTADKAVTTNSFAGVPLDLSNYKKGLEAVTGLTFAEDEDFYRYLIEKVVAINPDPVDHVLSPTGLARYSNKPMPSVNSGWVVDEIQSLMVSLYETRKIDPDALHGWLNEDNNAHNVTDRAIKKRILHGYRLESEIGFVEKVVVPMMMRRRDTLLTALKQLSDRYGDDKRSHDETVLIAILMGKKVERTLGIVPTARWEEATVSKVKLDLELSKLYWWNAASGHHTNEYSLGEAVRDDLVRTMSIGDEPLKYDAFTNLMDLPRYSVYRAVAYWIGTSVKIASIRHTDVVHGYGALVLSVIGKVTAGVTVPVVLDGIKKLIGDDGIFKEHFTVLDTADRWVRKHQRRLTDSTADTLDGVFGAMATDTPSSDPTEGGFMVTINSPNIYDSLNGMSPDQVKKWIYGFTLPYADPASTEYGVPEAWDGMRLADLKDASGLPGNRMPKGLTANQVAILLEAEAVVLHVPSDDEDEDLEGDISRKEAAAAKRQNEAMKTTTRTKSATGSGSGGIKTPARTPRGKNPASASSKTPVKRGRESMGTAGNTLKQTDTKGTPEKDK
jgi:hypothetical protein